jgi:CheY-like chemotaxis protein
MPTDNAYKTVLIVDDDPLCVEVAKALFEVRGVVSIEAATSALDAYEAIDTGRAQPDLIVCDLNMPGFDGVEFLGRLQHAGCRSRILLVSGAHDSIVRPALVLGRTFGLDMVGAVAKPLTAAQLDVCLGADPKPSSDLSGLVTPA